MRWHERNNERGFTLDPSETGKADEEFFLEVYSTLSIYTLVVFPLSAWGRQLYEATTAINKSTSDCVIATAVQDCTDPQMGYFSR